MKSKPDVSSINQQKIMNKNLLNIIIKKSKDFSIYDIYTY